MKSRSVSVTILVFLLHCFSVRSEEPINTVEAVYIFGDSGFDCGNNNDLNIDPKMAKANYKPYGVDFDGGPTGRFTNGKNDVDFIAEKLGLPLAPAYLSLSREKRQKIATGLNYASASGGILSETGTALGKGVPFDEQIDHFQRTVEEDLPPQFSSKEEEEHLSRSVIVINIGSSDFLNNWIDQEKPEYKRSKKYPQIPKYVNLLIETFQGQIQRIYDLGGRRFLVFGLGPLGCVAAVTHKGAPCNESWNGMALEFNKQLAPLIQRLQSTLQGSIIVLEHAYNLILDLHRNPSRYGFKSVNQPCCVVSRTELPALCIPGTKPCENRDEHLYYDMFHGTSKAAEIVVDSCFDAGSSTCDPNAIRKLISDKDM